MEFTACSSARKRASTMTEKKKSVFETLSAIDVSEHVEQKMGLNYLSWSWCWATLKSIYPDTPTPVATKFQEMIISKDGYHMTDRQVPYLTTPTGTMVEVTLIINGVDYTQSLYVMDHRSRAVVNPDQGQINTTTQRCMVKAAAMAGLGLNLYAGEDLPMGDISQQDRQQQAKKNEANAEKAKVKAYRELYNKDVAAIAKITGQNVDAVNQVIGNSLGQQDKFKRANRLTQWQMLSEFASNMLKDTQTNKNQQEAS